MALKEDFNADQFVKEHIQWNAHGLIPAVVQDAETREVLMLAFMNEESLKLTLTEKRAWYYSRSRQKLWRKGETSGHTQEVVDIKFDCDQDAVLLLVKQTGMACHEDFYTCFHYEADEAGLKKVGEPNVRPKVQEAGGEKRLGDVLEELAQVIHSRRVERPEGAYTTYLFDKGIDKILKKVGEESAEVIIAAKNNDPGEIRYEVSDLFYHVLVMLEDRGVDVSVIAEELASRRKAEKGK